MKLTTVVAFALLLAPAAHADEKIEKIVDLLNFQDGFEAAVQNTTPISANLGDAELRNEYAELAKRQHQEELDLHKRYINWESIKQELIISIEQTYTQQEIDAVYDFIATKHGESFLKKFPLVEKSFSESFSRIYKTYANEATALLERHQNESAKLIAQLEEESQKEEVTPADESGLIKIADVVRFMVATENGNMVGYRVRPGSKPDLFEKSPFNEEDLVVSINGIPIDEPDRVREVYQMLKTFTQLHFEVRRNGEFADFVIDLMEIESRPE